MLRRRYAAPVTALTLLVAACAPGLPVVVQPAAVTPSPALPAQGAPVPTPAVAPVAADPVAVPKPVLGVTPIQVSIQFPAGAFTKVKSGLRTQATVPPEDLLLTDLQLLNLQFQGRTLSASEYTIGGMHYDAAGNLVISLQLHAIQGPGVLRIATPGDGVVMLAGIGAGTTGTTTVDAMSTANALLDQALQGQPALTDAAREDLLGIVLRKVQQVLVSSGAGNIETNGGMKGLLNRIASAVAKQDVLDAGALGTIETPPSTGGGGGAATAPVGPAQPVTTLAGSTSGSTDATGTAAKFNGPLGVAVDGAGNVYVGDTSNHRIRKITPAGVVTTLAGSTDGYTDDTGTAAKFSYPQGVAVDGAGNVYVAENETHRIRKITAAGVVTTLAGGTSPLGDVGNTDDTGTLARFTNPVGLAVDGAGNVYVADSGNHRIRKITAAGVVTTLAGSSMGYTDDTGILAKFNQPQGVAVDAAGNVYVGDSGNHKIRKITPAGVVTTLAGSTNGFMDATGTAAKFATPVGVAVDAAGNVYVGDNQNFKIRKITPAGVVTTLAGSTDGYLDHTTGLSAKFSFVNGVAVDGTGNVYVADSNNNKIRKIEP